MRSLKSGEFSVGTYVEEDGEGNILFSETETIFIKKVIYNDPCTIVFWSDNTKTVSKCFDGDSYSKEAGLAICVAKKFTSPSGIRDLFHDWIIKDKNTVTVADVRKAQKNK